MSRHVVVVDTGAANLASVLAALRRAGAEPVVTRESRCIEKAERLLLPGVGAFGAGMGQLKRFELIDSLREYVGSGRPMLAICLGLQLLCDSSDESPGVTGLGVLDAKVTRFDEASCVPQMGWNRVVPEEGCRLIDEGYAYFANSFRLASPPAGWRAASSHYGRSFVAAVERDAVVACQFHPELSGVWGQRLIERGLALKAGSSC